MKIRHVEAVFLEYDAPFFFLSQSRQERQEKGFASLRLCEKDVFSPGIKTGSTFSRRVSLFSSVHLFPYSLSSHTGGVKPMKYLMAFNYLLDTK
jgi:hypothetical protein